MPRWLKVALAAVAGVVALVAIGLAVVASTIDLEHYARLATERIRAATGRELAVNGKLSVSVFPHLTIAAEDVTFANAPWGSRKEMVRIRRVEASVSLVSLLRGRVEIARLDLIEPDVLLETSAKGVGNWVFEGKTPAAPANAGQSGPGLGIWALDIARGSIVYRAPGREPVRLALARVQLRERSLVAIDDVDVAAELRGQAFTVKGSMGTLAALLERSERWPVDLAFEAAGGKATIAGQADWRSQRPGFRGDVRVAITETVSVSRLAGGPVDLPTPLSVEATLDASPREQRIDPLRLVVGKTSAQGRVILRKDGPRPYLTAELSAKDLDLSTTKRPAPAKGGRVFSDTPFPLDALRSVDGEASLAVGRLVLPSRLPLENVEARAQLKGGRLEVAPFSALVAGGTAKGSLTLDASTRSPTAALQLDVRQLQAGTLAKSLGRGTVTGGSTDVSAALRGPGESMRRFMGGANGELRLSMGPARMSGLGLDSGGDVLSRIVDAIRGGTRPEQYTELQCMAVRLPVHDGIATSQRSIAVETTRVNVVAAGTINFRNEALDLALRPTVKEGLGIGAASFAELVKVTGTLGDPSIGIDTLASAKAALSVGGAVLTSGLSLLGQRLLDRRENDPNPCRTALGGSAAPSATTPAKPAQEDESVLGSIRRMFR